MKKRGDLRQPAGDIIEICKKNADIAAGGREPGTCATVWMEFAKPCDPRNNERNFWKREAALISRIGATMTA